MCIFSLEMIPETYEEEGSIGQFGKITLGDYSESFLSLLDNWDVMTYSKHWLNSSSRILYDCTSSLFVTNIEVYSPLEYQLDIWVAYKIGEIAYIQNHLMIPDTYSISGGFNIENLYTYVRDREIYSENGKDISEWVVPLKWIENYYLVNKVILQ